MPLKMADGLQQLDIIKEFPSGKELTVEWFKNGITKAFDFAARYNTPAGRDSSGVFVYGNRGFRFNQKGSVWVKVKSS